MRWNEERKRLSQSTVENVLFIWQSLASLTDEADVMSRKMRGEGSNRGCIYGPEEVARGRMVIKLPTKQANFEDRRWLSICHVECHLKLRKCMRNLGIGKT